MCTSDKSIFKNYVMVTLLAEEKAKKLLHVMENVKWLFLFLKKNSHKDREKTVQLISRNKLQLKRIIIKWKVIVSKMISSF